MYSPLVSVVIPTFNRVNTVVEAITSAINQTYGNLEIIVVDDGSTDGTFSALQSQFEDKIQLRSQANAGQASATALAMKQAKGEFIAFLDDDDLWKPDKVSKQLEAFRNRPDVVAVHTDAEEFATIGVDHISYLDRHPLLRSNNLMNAMVHTDTPLRSTVMCRRDFMMRHNIAPDPSAAGVDDIQMFMEIIGNGGEFALLDEVTTYRRMHQSSFSSDHYKRIAAYECLLLRRPSFSKKWTNYVQKALADAYFRVGESHWGQGEYSIARHFFGKSFAASKAELRSLQGIILTWLPPRLTGLLRKFKGAALSSAKSKRSKVTD